MTRLRCALLAAAVLLAPAAADAADWHPPERLRTGEAVHGNPHDAHITADGLYLLVADVDHHAIAVLVPGTVELIGRFGEDDLSSPHDVATGPDGLVYVADTGNGRIAIYRFNGTEQYGDKVLVDLVGEWSDGIVWPEGIAIAPTGAAYVADVRPNAILKLVDGKIAARVTEAAGMALSRPHDVHVAPDGSVYATDPGNDRVIRFDAELNVIGVLDKATYGFDEPKYLAVDEDGMLFVADEHNDRIVMIGADGGIAGVIEGDINHPEGVEVAGRYIWVMDTSNNRALLYRRHSK